MELGMTPDQVDQLFTVKEDSHLLSDTLKKYFMVNDANKEEVLQIHHFLVSPDKSKLPEGVMWAEINTIQNKVYQIVLHYDEPSVERMGWKGVTSPYILKYGKPDRGKVSAFAWCDNYTRLDIDSTGSTISVLFTDRAMEAELNKNKRN